MTTEVISKTRTLAECEAVIERGLKTFIEVGNALLEIRDNRLYKEAYSTFESYCKERWGFDKRYANYQIAAAQVIGNLGTIVPTTESQARPLSQLEPELQREVWQRVTESGNRITASRIQEEVDKFIKPHVAQATGESEWFTPSEYIEAARQVMGSIDTDPASTDKANEIVKATTYYTQKDDGREQTWTGNIWLNPPYTQPLVSQFCTLLISRYSYNRVKQACVLVNNATETLFYQDMLKVCSAVCFIRGRVKFLDNNGVEGAPLQGQTILYFGTERDKFTKHFQKFGVILYAK